MNFQNGLSCGGAYIKLLSSADNLNMVKDDRLHNLCMVLPFFSPQFHDSTPYSIMFGPDKCGKTSKLHFILRYKNPITEEVEEKHSKQSTETMDLFDDKKTHLFTLCEFNLNKTSHIAGVQCCGMLWNVVECCGMLWNVVECCGMLWNVEWCMLWNGACCGMVHVVEWCMLWNGACCGMVHVVEWCMLWNGACCGMVHVVEWCMLWNGACCGMVHVVEWCMLWNGACCGMVHVVEWCMLWNGACCGMVHVVEWCMLWNGAWVL